MFLKSYCKLFQGPITVSAEEVCDNIRFQWVAYQLEVKPSDYYIKSDRVTDTVNMKKETLTGHTL